MCPTSYKYHYIDSIRSVYHTGALAFGAALDQALNELLLPTGQDALQVFEKEFTNGFINRERVYLPTNSNMVYSNNDYDDELLQPTDREILLKYYDGLTIDIQADRDVASIYSVLKKKKQDCGFDSFTAEEKQIYNYINWMCLYRKGELMLKAYSAKVMPMIEEVISVQEKIDLTNEDGDSVTGVVDLVARVKGHGIVILDNKTSGMDYEEDSVVTSPQLSLYVHALKEKYGTQKAGYIVLKKQIKKNRVKTCSSCLNDGTGSRAKTCDAVIEGKRCGASWDESISPEVGIQIIIDTIPEKLEAMVVDNYADVNHAIKSGVFTKNFNSCKNTYGGNCPYYNLCHKSSMDGLIYTKKEK